jgi:amidohydrolase
MTEGGHDVAHEQTPATAAPKTMTSKPQADRVLDGLPGITGHLEDLYRDLHSHPELSMQEHRTAAKAAEQLEQAGFEVTAGVGKTGVVGLLRNGDGPTVMLRADMDALPVKEETGLPYASTVTAVGPSGDDVPVMHACGHDMHVTWLAGAAKLLAQVPDAWRGTLMAVFQPAEETGEGAQAMIDDGLFKRFRKPEVVLGQHVLPPPAGHITYRPGITQSVEDNIDVRMIGRGGHGAWPEATVDPVVMAASTVLRLQTIVSREVAASTPVIITIGSLQAGIKGNVIPDDALLKINVRTFDDEVRKRVLASIERIVKAEASASGAPQEPEFTYFDHFPLTVNDPRAANHVGGAFRHFFGADRVEKLVDPLPVSEDFGSFGTEWGVPSVFWYVGGTDPDEYRRAEKAGRVAQDVPTNHSSKFAPVLHPTLETGIQALTVGSLSYLGL